ncbi:MAG: MiaB/RimO family radical SAM methylthiotransferase [Candidatus Nealsonbacteria bacterium]
MPKYYIITYGCQMNKSDSERISSVLENKGYLPTSNETEADLIVVNMCSVRQSAVDRVYGLAPKFKKLKTKKPKLKTVLTGCILKKDKKKFREIFDSIWNMRNYFDISPKCKSKSLAFVPISNGCNNLCAYCVVPYTRGPLVCRNHQEVLKEIKDLVKKGFKEIWLLGQNVNDYHSSSDSLINFPKLLKLVNDIPGTFWIRFISSHPKDFSNDLIDAMAECEKVTEYLNLPVQSGDNEILKRMNRPYTVKQYKNLVKKIRKKIPDITLSTDIIVGFPGEKEKQFQNTVKLFKEIKYDMAYIAKYSPRPQTAASKLKDDILPEEKERRWKILTEVLKQTALKKNRKYIGKRVEALVNEQKNGFLIGKTRTYKTVKFGGQKNLIGQFVKVKIIDALSWGLKGILI